MNNNNHRLEYNYNVPFKVIKGGNMANTFWKMEVPANTELMISYTLNSAQNQYGTIVMIADQGDCTYCKYVSNYYCLSKYNTNLFLSATPMNQIILYTPFYVDIASGDTEKAQLEVHNPLTTEWVIKSANEPSNVTPSSYNDATLTVDMIPVQIHAE